MRRLISLDGSLFTVIELNYSGMETMDGGGEDEVQDGQQKRGNLLPFPLCQVFIDYCYVHNKAYQTGLANEAQ